MHRRGRLLHLAGIAFLLLAWWTAIPPRHPFIPQIGTVAEETLDLIRHGVLQRDTLASLGRVIPGVALAFAVAAVLGTCCAVLRGLGGLVDGVIELLRPIPPIAWAPIAILAFGIGNAPAVAIVFLGSFFPIWLGVQQGFREVRLQHLLAAQSFGASQRILVTDVILPSVVPYSLHGLRVGFGIGWFCVVAAEMMGAQSGLGYGVQLFSLNLELGRTYAYLLGISALGAVTNYLMQALERRLVRWHRLDLGIADR